MRHRIRHHTVQSDHGKQHACPGKESQDAGCKVLLAGRALEDLVHHLDVRDRLIRVDRSDLRANVIHRPKRIALGPQRQECDLWWIEPIGNVDLHFGLAGRAAMLHVGNHTDDIERFHRHDRNLQTLTDRRPLRIRRPVLSRERFIDDGDAWSTSGVVARLERSPLLHPLTDHLEITWHDRLHHLDVAWIGNSLADDLEIGAQSSGGWQSAHDRRAANAGNRLHARHELVEESRSLLGRVVRRHRQRNAHRQQAGRWKAQIDMREPGNRLPHEPRTDEKNQ